MTDSQSLPQTSEVLDRQDQSSMHNQQSTADSAMEGTNSGKEGRVVGGAQGHQTVPYYFLKNPVYCAIEQIHCREGKIYGLEKVKELYRAEREGHRAHNCKEKITYLEGILRMKEGVPGAECKNGCSTITEQTSEISCPKETLPLQEEKMAADQCQSKQEFDKMVERYEAEKVADQNKQAMLESQLREYQVKVNQMEEQIQQRDTEILALSSKKDSFYRMLTDTTNKLLSKGPELLHSENAWQAKYNALEAKLTEDLAEKLQSFEMEEKTWQAKHKALDEKFSKELAKREDLESTLKQLQDENKNLAEKKQSWETKEKEAEDEKKEPEDFCLKLERKRRGFLFGKKKSEARNIELQKMQSRMHEKEMKKKAKEETVGTENQETVDNRKGFLRWMHKKKCDGVRVVEEAAGCSTSPPLFLSH